MQTCSGAFQDLEPFSFTFVQYQKGDLFGKFLALCSLSPIFLIISFVTLVIMNRNPHTFSFLVFLLINEVLNLGLKNVIKEERPNNKHSDGFGMPSSHSQFMSFFTTFCMFYIHKKGLPANLRNISYLVYSILFGITICVAYSRVYLGYHTEKQVIMGLGIGIIFATLCFHLLSLLGIMNEKNVDAEKICFE